MSTTRTARRSSRSLLGAISTGSLAIVAMILLGSAAAAAPVAIYDGITTSTSTGSDTATTGTWFANQFNTDVATYDLNSVILDFSAAPLGTIAVDIYGDASGTPTGNLGTLVNPGVLGTGSNTFTASGILPLAANSSFWVVLRGVAGGTADWLYTGDTPSGVGSSMNTNFSTTAGASWAGLSSGTPYMMTVNATPVAVPEPSTWAMGLAGLAFAGVKLVRSRRRQA